MKNRDFTRAIAGLALVATASLIPSAASIAHDGSHKFEKKLSENLGNKIEARVHAGMAKGAIGMEKGADKMLRGADKMEAYADRLERDSAFREAEATKQNKWNEGNLTADELLEQAPEFRRGAAEMREGAAKMRRAAEKMRRRDMN